MDQARHKKYYRYVSSIFLATACVISAIYIPLHALESDIASLSNQRSEKTEFHRFEEILDVFETKIDEEEAEIDNVDGTYANEKGFFLFKWKKNLKKWFKKKVVKMMRRYAGLRKCKTKDDLAKSFVKFKKKVDKKLYKTGKLETILSKIDDGPAGSPSQDLIQDLKNRVRFHYYKKKQKKNIPPDYQQLVSRGLQEEKEHKHNHLEGYTVQQVIGGLEIFCGVLIAALPLPGCGYLGGAIATDGLQRLISEEIKKIESNNDHTDSSKRMMPVKC